MHGLNILMAKNYIDNLSEEVQKGVRTKEQRKAFGHRMHLWGTGTQFERTASGSWRRIQCSGLSSRSFSNGSRRENIRCLLEERRVADVASVAVRGIETSELRK
jgi:hypothetical protein